MADHDDAAPARTLLLDAFGRIHDAVGSVLDGIDPTALRHRPDADANTVAWLVWHLTRVQDGHLAELADTEPRWRAGGWVERFALDLDPEATGYGAGPEEVAALDDASAELLAGYHEEVHVATVALVEGLTTARLAEVVDDSWDPPVTASVRLVSVVEDCLMHAGQAAYVRGLAERVG